MAKMDVLQSYNKGDQGFLNAFFSGTPVAPLLLSPFWFPVSRVCTRTPLFVPAPSPAPAQAPPDSFCSAPLCVPLTPCQAGSRCQQSTASPRATTPSSLPRPLPPASLVPLWTLFTRSWGPSRWFTSPTPGSSPGGWKLAGNYSRAFLARGAGKEHRGRCQGAAGANAGAGEGAEAEDEDGGQVRRTSSAGHWGRQARVLLLLVLGGLGRVVTGGRVGRDQGTPQAR